MTTARCRVRRRPAARRGREAPCSGPRCRSGRADAPAERDAVAHDPRRACRTGRSQASRSSHPDPTATIRARSTCDGRRRDAPARAGLEAPALGAGSRRAPRPHRRPAAADTARRRERTLLTVGADVLVRGTGEVPRRGRPTARLLAHETARTSRRLAGAPGPSARAPAEARRRAGARDDLDGASRGRPQAHPGRHRHALTVPGVHAKSFDPNGTHDGAPAPARRSRSTRRRRRCRARQGCATQRPQSPATAAPPLLQELAPSPSRLDLAHSTAGSTASTGSRTTRRPVRRARAADSRARRAARCGDGAAGPEADPARTEGGTQAPPDPVATKLTQGGHHPRAHRRRTVEALRGAVLAHPRLAARDRHRARGHRVGDADAGRRGAGEYDPETHTVTLKASIFTATDMPRLGEDDGRSRTRRR